MERCAVCGAEEFIPYVCRYCGRVHCVYHRLPENHECPNIEQARAPRTIIRSERQGTGPFRLLANPRLSAISGREISALLTALLVLGVSFSFQFFRFVSPVEFLEIFLLTLVVVGTGFLGHELAHKFAAERYGCWAEFKLWVYGAVMALLFTAVSQGQFVFAAPGAVYIVSRSGFLGEGIDRKANGVISIIGPLANVVVAAIFGLALLGVGTAGVQDIVIGPTGPSSYPFRFLYGGFVLNIWLGAFNMLPIFILDGQKVYSWDRRIWAALAIPLWAATIALFILRGT